MCEATSLKNIKYKTLPYSISNHSIYKFIFSKKCKRYSNSTQFKFFFSALKFPQEEFRKQDTLWNTAAVPIGLPGSLTVPHFGVGLPRITLAGTFKCGNTGTLFLGSQVELKCPRQTSPSKVVFHKTQPLLVQEILFLRRYPSSHLPCPSLVVSS